MAASRQEIEAWVAKLKSWQGRFTPNHPHIGVVTSALGRALVGVREDIQELLVGLFAGAFSMEVERAREVLLDNRKSETAEKAGHKIRPYKVLPELPVHMDILKMVCDWTEPLETPQQYALFSFITAASAGIGRGIYTTIGPYVIYPNIYTILIGSSGARKDSAIDLMCELFKNAAVDLRILPDEGSIHGILNTVYKLSPTDARGFFVVPELRVMLGSKGDTTKETGGVWLTHLYKAPLVFERSTLKYHIRLENTYFTLLGGTTSDWLVEMPQSIMSAGFLARVLLVSSFGKKGYYWSPKTDKDLYEDILERLDHAYGTLPQGEAKFDNEAYEFMKSWYEDEMPQIVASSPPIIAPFLERAHVHAIKLSLVLAVLDCSPLKVTYNVAKQAVDLVMWAANSMASQVENIIATPTTRIYGDILQAISSRRGKLALRHLVRVLRNKHRAPEVKEAVDHLVYQGDLELEAVGKDIVCVLSDKAKSNMNMYTSIAKRKSKK